MEPHDFSRERQVLDGSPARNHTELRHVEVRIAGEIRRLRIGIVGDVGSAISTLGSGDVGRVATVPHGRVAAEQAGRPVRIPVVLNAPRTP